MAIAHVSTTTTESGASNVTSHSFSHTVASGADRLLVVRIGVRAASANAPTGVTFNGDALTQKQALSDTANAEQVSWWFMVAPDVATANVVITLAGGGKIVAAASDYTGVDQTTPTGTAVTASGSSGTLAPTVDASSASGELVLDVGGNPNSAAIATVGAGQTERLNLTNSGSDPRSNTFASDEAGASTVTMSWDLSLTRNWALIAVPILPAASSANATVTVPAPADATLAAPAPTLSTTGSVSLTVPSPAPLSLAAPTPTISASSAAPETPAAPPPPLPPTTFAVATARGHGLATRLTLLPANQPLYPVDGSVTLEESAATRGRANLSFVGEDMVAAEPGDPLAPYGNEVKVERGVTHPDGSQQFASLGVFRIEDTAISDKGTELTIANNLLDRSQQIIDDTFGDVWPIASGTNFAEAILDIIQGSVPDIEYDFATTAYVTPKTHAAEGDDRWQAAQDLAAMIGHRLYFNGDGILVLEPVVSNAEPVAEIGEGGVLLGVDRNWTRAGAYNKAIFVGENTSNSAVYRGEAIDDNPLSPTYYYGDFGRKPAPIQTSSRIDSDEQAADAAAAFLTMNMGTSESIGFETIPNPSLVPGDAILLNRPRAGITSETHYIDNLTIGLGATESMSGGTRAVRVVE